MNSKVNQSALQDRENVILKGAVFCVYPGEFLSRIRPLFRAC